MPVKEVKDKASATGVFVTEPASFPAGSNAIGIKPPRFQTMIFDIGNNRSDITAVPLVIHRFSAKTKMQMKQKMETGSAGGNKKNREAKATDDLFMESRYISDQGWDGFHAGAIRNALIRACTLVGIKMTQAKMSMFVIADGHDALEPQIPLVRIYGKPVKQEDMARVETGQPYVTVRAAYHDWHAKVKIRWDLDQMTASDVATLMHRVGIQVGLCEGRPSSPNSNGMGWGLFEIKN